MENLVLDSKPDAEDDAEMGGAATSLLEGQGMMLAGEGERAARDNIGYVGRDEALNIQAKDTPVPVAGWSKEEFDPDL